MPIIKKVVPLTDRQQKELKDWSKTFPHSIGVHKANPLNGKNQKGKKGRESQ
jgi:hypothetical protein